MSTDIGATNSGPLDPSKYYNTLKDETKKNNGVALSADGNFLMIKQKVGGFLGFGGKTAITLVNVSVSNIQSKQNLQERVAKAATGKWFQSSKTKAKNVQNELQGMQNPGGIKPVTTVEYKKSDKNEKLGQLHNLIQQQLQEVSQQQQQLLLLLQKQQQQDAVLSQQLDEICHEMHKLRTGKSEKELGTENLIPNVMECSDPKLQQRWIDFPNYNDLNKKQPEEAARILCFVQAAKEGKEDMVFRFENYFQNSFTGCDQSKSDILNQLSAAYNDDNKEAINKAITLIIKSMKPEERQEALKNFPMKYTRILKNQETFEEIVQNNRSQKEGLSMKKTELENEQKRLQEEQDKIEDPLADNDWGKREQQLQELTAQLANIDRNLKSINNLISNAEVSLKNAKSAIEHLPGIMNRVIQSMSFEEKQEALKNLSEQYKQALQDQNAKARIGHMPTVAQAIFESMPLEELSKLTEEFSSKDHTDTLSTAFKTTLKQHKTAQNIIDKIKNNHPSLGYLQGNAEETDAIMKNPFIPQDQKDIVKQGIEQAIQLRNELRDTDQSGTRKEGDAGADDVSKNFFEKPSEWQEQYINNPYISSAGKKALFMQSVVDGKKDDVNKFKNFFEHLFCAEQTDNRSKTAILVEITTNPITNKNKDAINSATQIVLNSMSLEEKQQGLIDLQQDIIRINNNQYITNKDERINLITQVAQAIFESMPIEELSKLAEEFSNKGIELDPKLIVTLSNAAAEKSNKQKTI
ncbi:MAG: hypothetical protein LBS71_02865 [Puniceicoccales bacterium]|jgi:hypothetical protein|nr:hypothetical protein [Puniceicoccales bacterium]